MKNQQTIEKTLADGREVKEELEELLKKEEILPGFEKVAREIVGLLEFCISKTEFNLRRLEETEAKLLANSELLVSLYA